MQNKKVQRKRAVAAPKTKIGQQRYGIYRSAYARINEAMKAEYYLEAITLTESLLADRLESYVCYLRGDDVFAFKPLGDLIGELRKNTGTNQAFKDLATGDVDTWRNDRNLALHEMVKIAEGDQRNWSDRLGVLRPVAEQGLLTLQRVDKEGKKVKKSSRIQP